MKLRFTISVKNFVKNISKGKNSRFLKTLLHFLEKHLGTQILLAIPPGLQKFNPKLLPVFSVASKLKSIGVIEEIIPQKKLPDEPFAYQFRTRSAGRAHGTGTDFLSEESAAWKALAETVERFLWFNSADFYLKKVCKTSLAKLKGTALDVFSLAGFSEEQKKQFPTLFFDENSVFGWIKAQSLNSTKKVWCPIQLFSNLYTTRNVKNLLSPDKKEPMLRWVITTGLATGRCLEEATAKGILEVIERDAFMISYLNKLSPPTFDLDYLSMQDEDISKLVRKFKRYNLEIYLAQLPSDFPVFIVAAMIVDRTGLGPAFSIGASADFNLKTCILDALSEALLVRTGLKNKYNQEVDKTTVNREERLIYWANPKNLSKIEFLFDGPKINIELDKNFFQLNTSADYAKYYTEKLALLTNELKKLGYAGYVAELTTKPIKKLNLRSVQVVIPELQPMHLDETIPYFSGQRLKDVPRKFGYKSREAMNHEPHPFP